MELKLKNFRLVVLLTDSAENESDNIGSTKRSKEDQELREKIEKMHFDFVGNFSEKCLETEVSLLMNDLVLERRNCCLTSFGKSRGGTTYNKFITQLDLRLKELNAEIQLIRAESFDIDSKRPYDMATFVNKQEFYNTYDLLVWLLKHYGYKSNNAVGQIFRLSIMDSQKQLFKVKFGLLQMYLDQMDNDTHINLFNYMNWLGGEGEDIFCDSPQTILLRNFFGMPVKGRMLLLFDVPTKDPFTLDWMELAQVLVKNRNKDSECSLKSVPSPQENTANGSPAKTTTMSLEVEAITSKPMPLNIPIKRNRIAKKRRLSLDSSHSRKDLCDMSTYLSHIDNAFQAVRESMNCSNKHCYETNITQMCNNIKTFALDNVIDTQMLRLTPANANNRKENESKINEKVNNKSPSDIRSEYEASCNAFQQLCAQYEDTKYAESLHIYFETKRYQLEQQELSLKIKYLNYKKERLNVAIDRELKLLESKKSDQ